ncbi:hypothetical protein M407DRAFT_222494 [Tulasnella calospora MUT 4182]|uniref:Uncharacterized protein n=1 Tax=Tulasnella calospora MUT 4182 TaxID=1051891 RepID=A0A0C3QGQ2_9AGAM|nr:hypothetical protein M407DRAFT_222494 [Tulasnella calospora MUT 4182]
MLHTDVLGMLGGSVADPAPAISIPVGITIGLLASFVQSLGITIQRKSHVLNQEAPESQRKSEHRRPLWLTGFIIFFLSNVFGSVFQIASLPVVILAPLGAVSLLWNAFFARFILGDLFSKFMVIGTLLIVAGAVLIARFGIVPEPTHSLEDLLRLFARDAFVIYFSLLAAAIFVTLVITHVLEWSLYKRIANEDNTYSALTSSSRSSSPIPLTPSAHPASSSTAEPTERTPLLVTGTGTAPSISSTSIGTSTTPFNRHRSTINIIAISYASASGTLSGMCLIFAKSGVELLMLTLAGDNQFWRWESWALVGGLVAFALMQLWYLHKSLILANPTLVCPLAFCFYNISSIVNGLVYYDQLDLLTPLQLWLVILGTAILLSGVWAVSITAEDEEIGEAGIREGDWIPADEPGVAPAVAPADVVRIAERATGTLPPQPQPIQIEPVHGAEPTSPTSEDDYFQHSPTRPTAPDHRRTRSGRANSTVPPLNTSPTLPRFSTLLSPSQHDAGAPVLPGFSIGISAASPGFIGGTRRRAELGMGHPHGNPNNRRSISDTVGPSGRSPMDRMERRRQSRTMDSQVDDGLDDDVLVGPDAKRSESPELMDGPAEPPRGSRWIWRILPWQTGHGRRTNGKDAEAQNVVPDPDN